MGADRRNLELKARDTDPERSLTTCEVLGAKDGGTLLQEDTYFGVSCGRLKLRQEGDAAQLIAYERSDVPGPRESRYRIVQIQDASGLKEALAETLGITVVVKKTRRLFLFNGVRIHLDRVDGLGSFIELEGVASAVEEMARFEMMLDDLQRSFGIEDDDLLAESYSDLALAVAGA